MSYKKFISLEYISSGVSSDYRFGGYGDEIAEIDHDPNLQPVRRRSLRHVFN